jgi:hypothetical protein
MRLLAYALGPHYLIRMAQGISDASNALGPHPIALQEYSKGDLRNRPCAFASCKVMFTPTRYWQRYCSVEHRSADFWKDKERQTVIKSSAHTTSPVGETQTQGGEQT